MYVLPPPTRQSEPTPLLCKKHLPAPYMRYHKNHTCRLPGRQGINCLCMCSCHTTKQQSMHECQHVVLVAPSGCPPPPNTHTCYGLTLHATHATQQQHSTIQHTQGPLHLQEVQQAAEIPQTSSHSHLAAAKSIIGALLLKANRTTICLLQLTD